MPRPPMQRRAPGLGAQDVTFSPVPTGLYSGRSGLRLEPHPGSQPCRATRCAGLSPAAVVVVPRNTAGCHGRIRRHGSGRLREARSLLVPRRPGLWSTARFLQGDPPVSPAPSRPVSWVSFAARLQTPHPCRPRRPGADRTSCAFRCFPAMPASGEPRASDLGALCLFRPCPRRLRYGCLAGGARRLADSEVGFPSDGMDTATEGNPRLPPRSGRRPAWRGSVLASSVAARWSASELVGQAHSAWGGRSGYGTGGRATGAPRRAHQRTREDRIGHLSAY